MDRPGAGVFESLLVTGAGGLVGSAVLRLAGNRAAGAAGLYRRRPRPPHAPGRVVVADLADERALEGVLREIDPSMVIHCAALSDIAPCEADPAAAALINAAVPARLAAFCRERGVPFVHFSTDQVFSGERGWYGENDEPRPVNAYGRTKAEGEKAVLAAYPLAAVMRISVLYGESPSGARSASERIREAARAGRVLRLFTNEFRTPLSVDDAARAALFLGAEGFSGKIHVAGPDRLSRFDFGRAVAARYGLSGAFLVPALSPGLAGSPPRPLDLSLDTSLAARVLPFPLRGVIEGLAGLP